MGGQVCENVRFVTGEKKCHIVKGDEDCRIPTETRQFCEDVDRANADWFSNAGAVLGSKITQYATTHNYTINERDVEQEILPPPFVALFGGTGVAIAASTAAFFAEGTAIVATTASALTGAGLLVAVGGVGMIVYEGLSE